MKKGIILLISAVVLSSIVYGCASLTGTKNKSIEINIEKSWISGNALEQLVEESNVDSNNPDIQDNDSIKAQGAENLELGL